MPRSRQLFKDRTALFILLNLIGYYFFLTLAHQKIDRYSIALFPSIILLISLFVSTLGKKAQITFVIAAVFLAGFVSYAHYPIYSAYYSPLFGGTSRALEIELYDNSGEYYAQAADYLSNKNRSTNVFVPYNYEAFSYFYNGNMQRGFTEKTNYIVTSVNHIKEITQCPTLEKTFGSRELEIVYVFKCN